MITLKQFAPSEFCLKCQGCCRFREENSVWLPCLMDEEIQELLDKKIPPAFISSERKIQPIPNPCEEGFICAFLGAEDNKCKIYDFRPFECRLYPFLIALRGKKAVLTVDLNCPYASEHLDSPEFKNYTDYLNALLNSTPMIELLKENPQALQAYEDTSNALKEIIP